MPAPETHASGRVALAALSVIAIGLLFIPLATGVDDFPLSTQPMFAAAREQQVEFVTARAVDPDGQIVGLTMNQLARTDDPLVAERVLARAVEEDSLAALCTDITRRLSGQIDAVEVISVTYDLDDRGADADAIDVEILFRCELP